MRELKYHEQKLLKKVKKEVWAGDSASSSLEQRLISMYKISRRDDVGAYIKMTSLIRKNVDLIKDLDEKDEDRIKYTKILFSKLKYLGLLDSKNHVDDGHSLEDLIKIPAARFCHRRLSAILVHNNLAPNHVEAVRLVESGQVSVGGVIVSDPSYHVCLDQEDLITWSEGSATKKHIASYKNEVDDYDLNVL